MRNVGIFYAYWTREWDVDFVPFVDKVKGLGFDQLEVNAGTVTNMTDGERKRLADYSKDQDIILSYGIGLTPDKDVSSLDEDTRRNGLEYMTRMIKAVGDMGGGMIGGTVHSYWPATMPEGLEDKSPILDQSLKSMSKLLPLAEENDVILNVEVINRFEQFLLNTAAEAVDYVSHFDSPNLGILMDTFHMNIEEDYLGESIQTAGSYLKSLHLGEPNRKPPGMGRMPWQEIRTALDAISFQGPLVMEPFVTPGGTIGRNIGVWRSLLDESVVDEAAEQSCRFVKEHLA